MPAPRPLKMATDAWVFEKRPKLNNVNTNRLWVSAVADAERYSYIFFTLPYPKGSTVTKGKLRIRNVRDLSGSVSITVSRVTEKWTASTVHFKNKPGVTSANSVTITKSNADAGSVWEFDVLPMLQTVSAGGKWWGFRISTSITSPISFYSANAQNNLRPELDVEWTDAPEAPDEVYPSGGRAVATSQPVLEFNFVDHAGDTELNACRVQFNSSNTGWNEDTGFAAPTWDSQAQTITESELDLKLVPGAPVLTSNVLIWWTVEVQDGSGKWSKYSEPASFKYLGKPMLTLNSPAASPNNYVEDATAPVDWAFTGTQTAYKILIFDPLEPDVILWNSGKIATSETDAAIPGGVIKKINKIYRLRLMVWDDISREKNGEEQIYQEVERDFDFRPNANITPPSGVVATQTKPWPWVDLSFNRTIMPDEFNIYRDDELIEANIEAADIFSSGSTYTYRDRGASPRVPHTWQVQAVVNGQASNKVASNPVTTRLLAPMMMEMDSSNPIYFMNPSVNPQQMGFQEAHKPVRSAPVLITQYQGGYEGHLEGLLVDDLLPGLTARDMRNRFKRWRKSPGKTFILYLVDETMVITPYNMSYVPEARSGTVRYRVSFDFFEVE